MRGQFLVRSTANFVEGNIYADKSSLILDWLLRVGIEKNGFSLREVAKDREVSSGKSIRACPAFLTFLERIYKKSSN